MLGALTWGLLLVLPPASYLQIFFLWCSSPIRLRLPATGWLLMALTTTGSYVPYVRKELPYSGLELAAFNMLEVIFTTSYSSDTIFPGESWAHYPFPTFLLTKNTNKIVEAHAPSTFSLVTRRICTGHHKYKYPNVLY